MADGAGGDVFLLLPQVLLKGGASTTSLGAEGLGLLVIERLLEQVQAEGGEEPLNYAANGRKATYVGNNVRTSLKRIVPSLGI